MIAALDVHYLDTNASAAAVLFEDWFSPSPVEKHAIPVESCGAYSPGEFYRRELQPLLAVIAAIRQNVSYFIIDGYCHLSAEGTPGLGAYLGEGLPGGTSIIGVAKNRFRETRHAVEVLRGNSKRPLFVTSIGLSYEEAAERISKMHGPYRVPTLLNEVDQLSRSSVRFLGSRNRT